MRLRQAWKLGFLTALARLAPLAIFALLAGAPRAEAQLFQDPPSGGVGNPAGQVNYGGRFDWGGFLFRTHHHTESYGEEAGKTAFGLGKTFVMDRIALFADGSYRIDNDGNSSASAGGGVRTLYENWLDGMAERIFGVNFWYDGDDQDRYYEQFGIGLESLGEKWDFRVNANIVTGQKEFAAEKVFLGPDTLHFSGHHLLAGTRQYRESAMTVVDAEAARRLGDWNFWAFGGCYYLDGGGKQVVGGKAGIRGYAARDLALSLTVTHDPLFDTTVVFGLTWFFDLTTRGRAQMAPLNFADRLREPVQRNDYVAVWKRQEDATEALTDLAGNEFFFVHVDSNAAAGGNGTFESPYMTLAQGEAGSAAGNYIFLHSSSVFDGQSITLKEAQKLLGDGVAGGHQVQTRDFGLVTLPSTPGPVPVISNAPGAAVTLANNNLVSGLVIENGAQGIVAPAGANNVSIDRVNVQDTAGFALEVQGASGTVTVDQFTYDGGAAGGGGMRFASLTGSAAVSNTSLANGAGRGVSIENGSGDLTFTNTTITDIGDTAFRVSGGSADVDFTGKIAQANNAAAVSVNGGHTGTLTFTPATAGDNVVEATNGTGLQFNAANGAYTFGRIALNGGDAGIDIVNSSGDFTFQSGTITNPTGVAVLVNGGAPNASIGTTITNDADRSVVVTGITGGEIDFNADITDTGLGVLVNDNTGGTVFFAEKLTLNTGANDAVTLTNNTGAVIGLSDLEINTTSGRGFVASGGGQIAVLGPDATIATTTGTALDLNGVVVHAAGMAFDSVSVDGAVNGILLADVTGGTISVGAGGAAAGDGGTLANTTGDAVSATNVAGLSLNFMNITNAGGDALHFDAADGTYTFNQVAVTGGGGGVAIVNGSDGSFTFTGTTITDPNGVAFSVDGGTADVDFTGKITQTLNNFAAVSVTGNHTGTLSFEEATAGDDVVEASAGPGLVFNNADGNYVFGQVALSGDAGIDITDSAGNFTFNSGTINNPSVTAVHVDGGTANVFVNTTIANDAGYSAAVENKTGGTVIFAGDITDTGSGVLVENNTGGSVQFTGALALNTGNNDAVTLSNNAGATVSFSDLAIDTTGGSGRGFVASGGGTVTVSGTENTIATADGTALDLNGVAVGAGGMNFKSISADGAVNGILLADVTGGTISVGAGGAAAGDGGTLANTTGDAVSATNVAGLSLNYMNITNAGGDGVHVVHDGAAASTVTLNQSTIAGFGGNGVELAATGAGTMTLRLTDNTLSGAAGAESILLGVDDSASQVNLTITGNNVDNGANATALSLNATGAGAKTVTMLMDGNTFVSDSATPTVAIADTGAVTLNATVTDSTFTNNGAGTGFELESNDAAAVVRLDLNGNTASGTADDFVLTNTAGTFTVFDVANVGANNTGNVTLNGVIGDDPGPIPTPP